MLKYSSFTKLSYTPWVSLLKIQVFDHIFLFSHRLDSTRLLKRLKNKITAATTSAIFKRHFQTKKSGNRKKKIAKCGPMHSWRNSQAKFADDEIRCGRRANSSSVSPA